MKLKNQGLSTCDKTSSSDECYTPRYAVLPLLKYLKQKEYKTIWCPFDTEQSEFVKVLRENYIVICSHKNDNKDFFAYEPNNYDIIISNPPYSIKDKVIKRCYELNKPFALLLPLTTLQGKNRFKYFSDGIEILAFDSRIGFYTKGYENGVKEGNWFASAYFCKNVLPEKLILEKLEKLIEKE
jgi:hypothetical protein